MLMPPLTSTWGLWPAEPGSRDLAGARQPRVVDALIASEGKGIEDALPVDIDTDQLGAALHRLVTIRAVGPFSWPPARPSQVDAAGHLACCNFSTISMVRSHAPKGRRRMTSGLPVVVPIILCGTNDLLMIYRSLRHFGA